MIYKTEFFYCSPRLLRNIDEINEIYACIDNVKWNEEFSLEHNGKIYKNQAAYNKALDIEFQKHD